MAAVSRYCGGGVEVVMSVRRRSKVIKNGLSLPAAALTGAVLLGPHAASAAVVYVDAASGAGGNTTLSGGGTFTPPLNGTTGVDNDWEQRTVFGSGGKIGRASWRARGEG